MNITEIITTPPRDEYLDGYLYKIHCGTPVVKIKDLVLEKTSSPTEIIYGLFDGKNQLVGYFELEIKGDNIWEVVLVQLAQAYKGLGYGTFFYDYAVMNDKLKIISDATNTGGAHGSKSLWKRLIDNNRYTIVGYDTTTKQIIPNVTIETIYNNQPNIRWLAVPPEETINESLIHIQSHMKNRYVVWYGPGSSTEDYYNF